MRHDAHGYWIEEAGLIDRPVLDPLNEDASADVVDRRWRLHGDVGGVVDQGRRARRRRAPARGRPLRLRPERAQRRLRQLDVVQPADDAHALLRRARPRGRARRRRARSPRSARWCEEQEVDAWFTPARLPAGVDLGPLRLHLGTDRRRLPPSSASRRWSSRSTATATRRAVARRSSAGRPSTRRRRRSSRRGSPRACERRLLERGRADPRAHAGRRRGRGGRRSPRDHRRCVGAGGRRGARGRRVAAALPAACGGRSPGRPATW